MHLIHGYWSGVMAVCTILEDIRNLASVSHELLDIGMSNELSMEQIRYCKYSNKHVRLAKWPMRHLAEIVI